MNATLYSLADLPPPRVKQWNRLLLETSTRSAFLSYAFCLAVERTRGGVFALHIEESDGEEGFLPFQIKRGRPLLQHAEKVGGAISDYFGIVGNVRSQLDGHQLLRAAGLSALRLDHAVSALCPFLLDECERHYGARLHAPSFALFQNHLLESNKAFVKSVLSRERKLATELPNLVFTWAATDPVEALDQLVAAKRAQYARTGVADALESKWRRELLTYLVGAEPNSTCTAIISRLEAGGRWIASKLSLICNNVLHSWFSAYDPAYRRYGPGHLLWFKVIEAACERGIEYFDFGEGEGGYKAEYGGESYPLLKGVIRQNSARGRSERVLQALQWRLEGLLVADKKSRSEREVQTG